MKGVLNPNLTFDPNTLLDFVEFSFSLPADDLFYLKWEDNLTKSGKEIKEICEVLKIDIDLEFAENSYWEKENNDVYVFHSRANTNTFLLFDFLKDHYDQCSMILIAVRVHKDLDVVIRDLLFNLYKKSSPRTNFQIDYFNHMFFRQVFNSSFFFYEQKTGQNRQQIHFGLDNSHFRK
jgi:hypothetical protein